MAIRLTVVVSQGQSNNPAKRGLEENLVAALLMEKGIDVTVIPNLYDLQPDGTGMLCLSGITGDMVIASWLYPRAAHWILDRHDIRGRVGETLLDAGQPDGDADEEDVVEQQDKQRVMDDRPTPARTIWCLDLRTHDSAQAYVEEIRRIAAEAATPVVDLMDWVDGSPRPDQMKRYLHPTNNTSLGGADGNGKPDDTPSSQQPITRVEEDAPRRWYPVIDYSRCTNCLECIDFCLFGVYDVDPAETILVQQPDNCRKGCPACSRVCPENAIIFPQHKAPAIAGSAAVDVGSLKIDLTKLFGPDTGESSAEAAARERDEQLILAGRQAVGMTAGIAKRQQDKEKGPKDELDDLMDELDTLEL